jgi:hypothetical protein
MSAPWNGWYPEDILGGGYSPGGGGGAPAAHAASHNPGGSDAVDWLQGYSITPSTDATFLTGSFGVGGVPKVMNLPRNAVLANTVILASQRLQLMACPVWPGLVIKSITWAASAAANTPTHQWFNLVDPTSLQQLSVTSDDTSTAWAANSLKTLDLTGPYTVPGGIHLIYVGIMVQATGVPNLFAITTLGSAPIHQLPPQLSAGSTTGMGAPVSNGTVVALTTGGSIAWCMLS